MNTIVGWLGISALASFFADLDELLISFHWTIPLAFAIVGLILVMIDELADR